MVGCKLRGERVGLYRRLRHLIRSTSIATGSKDKCVGFSTIRESAITPVSLFERHTGVVKSAQLRPVGGDGTANIVASTGNDGALCIWDARAAQPLTSILEDVSSLALNAVRWHPANPHQVRDIARSEATRA